MTKETLQLLQQCLMQTEVRGVPGSPEFLTMCQRHLDAQRELADALSTEPADDGVVARVNE